jgi:hypothetical protein
MSNVHKPAAAAAGTGVLAGLAAIFLPLVQALPGHLPTGSAETAIGSGALLVVGSILGFLKHHELISTLEAQTASSFVTSHQAELEQLIAQQPLVREAISKVGAVANDAKAKALEVEAKVPDGALLANAAEQAAAKAVAGLLAKLANAPAPAAAPVDAEVQAVTAVPAEAPEVVHAHSAL